MRASTTDDNAAFADSDKSNVKIYFLTVPNLAPQLIRIDLAVLPVTFCKGLFNQIHRKFTFLGKKIRTPFRIYCQKEFLLFIIYLSDVGGILSAPSLTERRPKLLSRVP